MCKMMKANAPGITFMIQFGDPDGNVRYINKKACTRTFVNDVLFVNSIIA